MDTQIVEMAENVTSLFDQTFTELIERRDAEYNTAIAPLDAERESLTQEHGAIGEASANLEKILPARAREAQREADVLTVAGKHEEAEAKIAEAEDAKRAPSAMNDRQREIDERIAVIDREKRAIARRVFEQWYAELLPVCRAAERGFLVILLDGLEDSFTEFMAETGTGATNNR